MSSILTPVLRIVTTAGSVSATPGGTVTYTITVTNTGQVPFAAANFTDALAGVLDDAAYNGDASATRGTATFGGQAIDLERRPHPRPGGCHHLQRHGRHTGHR